MDLAKSGAADRESSLKGYWHVTATDEGHQVWTHDGDAPMAICLSPATAHRIVDEHNALIESVRLQSHYARLLNNYDGGRRSVFDSVDAWLERLATASRPGDPS